MADSSQSSQNGSVSARRKRTWKKAQRQPPATPAATEPTSAISSPASTRPGPNVQQRPGGHNTKGQRYQKNVNPKPAQTNNTGHKTHQTQIHGRGQEQRYQTQFRPNQRHATSQNSSPESNLSAAALQEYLETGLESIRKSEESRRSFITKLTTDSGLSVVLQLLETDYATTYSVLSPTFEGHCIPFLQILSNSSVLTAVSLEHQVDRIYGVVNDPSGERAPRFLRRVLNCLEDLRPGSGDGAMDEADWKDALHMSAIIFHVIFKKRQNAILNEKLQELSRRLPQLATFEALNKDDKLNSMKREISKVVSIFNDGANIETEIHRDHSDKFREDGTSQQHTETPIDFPGGLSAFGPRHDNDHELISNISNLPTISEILSKDRKEFLPTKLAYEIASHHHQHGIRRLIDIQYRLLREDTSGRLRDSLRFVLDYWEELTMPAVNPADWQARRTLIRNKCPSPIRLHSAVAIRRLQCTENKHGLEAFIEFDQPRHVQRLNYEKRYWWWRKSQELREGKGIVALIEHTEEDTNIALFVVSRRNLPNYDEVMNNSGKQAQETTCINDLSSHPHRASIALRLVKFEDETEQARLVHLATKYHQRSNTGDFLMVEFTTIVYKHFEGILRRLQYLHQNSDEVPFSKWLAPRLNNSIPDSSNDYLIPPPAYLRGEILDLSACQGASKQPSLGSTSQNSELTFSLNQEPELMAKTLAQQSTLDLGQAKAMVSAFRHEIALTQGPPGCGKSYVGIKTVASLLANKARLNLGPILCICYTSHALDQFLGELLKLGIKKIARLGKRTPIPEIQDLELDNYKKRNPQPKLPGVGHRMTLTKNRLEDLKKQINEVCKRLEQDAASVVVDELQQKYTDTWQQITRLEQRVSTVFSMGNSEMLNVWLTTAHRDDALEEKTIDELLLNNLWGLCKTERLRLFQYWHQSAVERLTQRLNLLMVEFSSAKKEFTTIFQETDRKILEQVDVLGLTTVGLANNCDIVRSLPAKVIVCEEAGEVLEAHVLAALLPSIQHAIFIGDHLQLRPKISTPYLSKEHYRGKYNFDESLFERLAGSVLGKRVIEQEASADTDEGTDIKFPVGQLEIQRRMHPDIANLVRQTLYPELQDHEKTKNYPEVVGMKKRLFWLDHKNNEDPADPSNPMQMMSKQNTWEAKMVKSLVVYLNRQGVYGPGEIAVLTPYVNQLKLIIEMLENIVDYDINELDMEELEIEDDDKKDRPHQMRAKLKKSKILNKIRMATVDNFQGEEATIIIVSLVRSNDRKECGFLKTPNRINVLLSRAKHGMYIIGDAATAMGEAEKSPMWKYIVTLFEKGKNMGSKLQLQCPRHPEVKTLVGKPDEFDEKSPEGGCSEKCGLRLLCGHICEYKCHPKLLHDMALCVKPCTRPRDCGHACRNFCKDPCGNCTEKILGVKLPCGHKVKEMACYLEKDIFRYTCKAPVEKTISECGHKRQIRCFQKDDPTIKCAEKCNAVLICGHICKNGCSDCTASGTHGECFATCGKEHKLCQHACAVPCHEGSDCTPCAKPCEVRCKHGKCPNKCSEACIPCAELCGWECEHTKERCIMPCSVPCAQLPCNKRCQRNLKCGHQCPSVCGEKCPSPKYCRECASSEVLSQRVDFIMMSTYEEIDLEEDPMVYLSCGHFYTMSSLDHILELDKHYDIDEEVGTRRVLLSGEALKGCPDCRGPLRDINRYNRIFKAVLLDELTRRFVSHSKREYAGLVQKLQALESKLEADRDKMGKSGKDGPQNGRSVLDAHTNEGRKMMLQINNYSTSVSKTEQPLGKVHELYIAALAQSSDSVGQSFDFDQSVIQTGLVYQSGCLVARARWILLLDKHELSTHEGAGISVRQSARDSIATGVKAAIEDTKILIKECRKAELRYHEVEARIYHAFFSMLSIKNAKAKGQNVDPEEEARMQRKEKGSLDECESIRRKLPGTVGPLKRLIEEAQKWARGDTFYTKVTSEEENMVVAAMAASFSGTGHWYYCVNGHPFTIGECGMPMELARCPECGQTVGGQNHDPVGGVRSAIDLETRGNRL